MPSGIYKRTKQHNEKIKTSQTGDKNARWKGGMDRWRHKQVLIRDDYTCKVCHLRDPEIVVVDHVKPKSIFPGLKNKLDNLITLCPNCHAKKTIIDRRKYRDKRFKKIT